MRGFLFGRVRFSASAALALVVAGCGGPQDAGRNEGVANGQAAEASPAQGFFGDFFNAQTTKKSQLDNLSFASIQRGQFQQRRIQCQQFNSLFVGHNSRD